MWFINDRIFYQYDGDGNSDNNKAIKINFTTLHTSIKEKQLILNPRIGISVDYQKLPFSFIIINEIAKINEEPNLDELLNLTSRIVERNMGKDKSKNS